MNSSDRRCVYLSACTRHLATEGGFHPTPLVFPELTPYADLAPHVLLRQLPDGYWQMLMLKEVDSPEAHGEWTRRVVDFARTHPELSEDLHLRIVCVGVGVEGLSRARRRRLLAPRRFQDNHVVVRSFWVSLERRRMFACKSPWSLAPSFEINPCDPDDNLLVELLRHDRYLKSGDAGPVTEEFHRRTLEKERTFRAGLVGKRRLVRLLLAVNVLVWLALELTGGSMNIAQLIRAGAKVNGLIEAGQYWRLVTPIFLHLGWIHLLFNTAGLYFLGEMLERIYGSAQFALIYFVSGVASVVSSYWFGGQIMVGASGSVFGLAGVLVVYGYLYRRRIPVRFSALFGGGLVPLIIVNLIFGMWFPSIDNSAHVGGLCAGVLVALLLTPLADCAAGNLATSLRRKAALVVSGVVVGSMVLAVVSLVRFPTVYDLDAEYLVSRTLPGGVKASLPATWYAYRDKSASIYFQSPVYPARVEARALRMESASAFFAEWQRIQRGGFQPGTPWQGAFFWMLALYETSRIEVPMIGPARAQRHQVFIRLKDDVLLSLGIQAAMKAAGDFAPVQVRILESLPHTRQE